MHYSIDQLVQRALENRIGVKGLHRLSAAGIDPSGLASSGIDPSNVPDVQGDLRARRGLLYRHALMAAQSGAPVSDAIQRRLALGPGGRAGRQGFAPNTTDEVQALAKNGDVFEAILGNLAKLRKNVHSQAGIYAG